MRSNPVVHQLPGHLITVEQMHAELQKAQHEDCTLSSCDMVEYCWRHLKESGHSPEVPAVDCPKCRKKNLPA
ncbi:hypothetical protein [Nocardia wallacei]|uniref:hypothetical protein n=1 Tax=Nocardia wallacei TaxID=480035 RepID=UPI0024554438|nr:hypothetical protein [Nocardia wallacei]